MGIIFAILIFSFIVSFMNLDIFTLAKLNGMMYRKFAIAWAPTLFSKEYKGTVYAVHLLQSVDFVQWLKTRRDRVTWKLQ